MTFDPDCDLERAMRDRVDDVRPLIEVDLTDEITRDMPAAIVVSWDRLTWLMLPMPLPDELRMEMTGYVDGDKANGPMELILRREQK